MNTEKTAWISTQIPVSLLEDFRRIAESEDRSVAAEVRRLIRRRVEEADQPVDEPTSEAA